MTAHVQRENRNFLMCPVRNCILPMENSVIQTAFYNHVTICKNLNAIIQVNTEMIECPLGHFYKPDSVDCHIHCRILKQGKFQKFYPDLVNLVSLYTVIPYAFKEKLQTLYDIPYLTFNLFSTSDETMKCRKRFFTLIEQAINYINSIPQKCYVCSHPVQNQSFSSFINMYNNDEKSKDNSLFTLNTPPPLMLQNDPYIDLFNLKLFN